MRTGAAYTRDAALRKLARINRWLIAGSVALTGVFWEVAAQAFPGKSATAAKARAKAASAHSHHDGDHAPGESAKTSSGALQPPSQPPRATTEGTPESESAQESAPVGESSQEAAAEPESAPAQQATPEEAAPAPESSPSQEAAPPQEPAPVVSGGS
jgi:hypothetical protein